MSLRRVGALLLAAALAGCASTPDTAASVATVESFRIARAEGRLAEARALLTGDPRVWYGQRRGEGSPWSLEGGRWARWDEHFRGITLRVGPWHVEHDSVWADFFEVNDYDRLLERGGGFWRGTWFLAPDGRLEGFMVSAAEGRAARRSGRREEFEAWAREHHPAEAEDLMPGGSLDPTGDRAPRMRALLERWRVSAGLEPRP